MTASAIEPTSSPAASSAPLATPAAAPSTEATKAAAPVAAAPTESRPTEAKAESYADKLEAALKTAPTEPAADAEFQLNVPEGADEHVVGFVKDAARIAGIPADKAQAVFDHVHKTLSEQRAAAVAKTREDFARGLYEDKTYGGANFEKTVRESDAFLRRFVPAESLKELEGKAIPPFLRIAFARAQQAISPDRLFVAKPVAASQAESASDAARRQFPRSLGQKG